MASNTEPCMTVDTSSAGARNWRYGTPPSAAAPSRVHERRRARSPSRRGTGPAARKLPKIEPRQVRTVEQPLVLVRGDTRCRWSERWSGTARRRASGSRDRHQSTRLRPVSRRKTSSSDAPADEHGLGREAALVGRGGRGLAVVGVDEHAVGQQLDPLAEALELAVERLLDADREPQLGHLAGRVAARSARAASPRRRSAPCP